MTSHDLVVGQRTWQRFAFAMSDQVGRSVQWVWRSVNIGKQVSSR